MNKKIIFSSGGTGGHIFPAINLMDHLSEKGYETVLVTDKRGSKDIGTVSGPSNYHDGHFGFSNINVGFPGPIFTFGWSYPHWNCLNVFNRCRFI